RRDDRGFRLGDTLVLAEQRPDQFTGRIVRARVTHIVRGPEYGIPSGFVMMSIDPWSRKWLSHSDVAASFAGDVSPHGHSEANRSMAETVDSHREQQAAPAVDEDSVERRIAAEINRRLKPAREGVIEELGTLSEALENLDRLVFEVLDKKQENRRFELSLRETAHDLERTRFYLCQARDSCERAIEMKRQAEENCGRMRKRWLETQAQMDALGRTMAARVAELEERHIEGVEGEL